MGNRLTKIYTRTGDDGTTALADGTRISKADLRFEVMGKIDLLNAQIGLLRNYLYQVDNFDKLLSKIQHQLFNIGGELAMPDYQGIIPQYITELEQQIDNWNTSLPRLKDFILPAGSIACSHVHLARCLCRDAERLLVALQQRDNNLSQITLQYINRLSDWLFVLARIVARLDGGQEVLWQKHCLE